MVATPGGAHPFGRPRYGKLFPLLHDQPLALLVSQIKFRHGSGFGRLLIRRFNGPEVSRPLPDVRTYGGEVSF